MSLTPSRRIKDRTSEFRAALSSLSGPDNAGFGFHGAAGAFSYSLDSPAGLFMERATAISRAFPAVKEKLSLLLKLARNKSLFDDRPEEFNALAATIKSDLAGLSRRIQDLKAEQERLSSRLQTAGRTAQEHWKNVATVLQTRAAQAFKSYEQTQDVRAQTLKSKNDRRDQFGASVLETASSANISVLDDASSTTRAKSPFSAMATTASRQRPMLDPSMVNVKAAHVEGYGAVNSPSNAYHDHVAIDFNGGEQQALLQQQHQMDPSTLRSRANALGAIEATINELGTIYSQLAHMVAQQGDLVQRIDMNIEDMGLNVQMGQTQLTRYLRRVSSNRWLIAKIFASFILFIIIFKFLFL